MGSQNDDQLSEMELVETKEEYPKKAKITYSRELLLSLSELDICRKLPSGFDPSILSEFDEAANSIPERLKIPGSLASQYFRRGESESYPPTRGDSSNISRGNDGRWKNRFYVLNDRNSDSRLDLESDFGKHYGSQSTWKNPENDGLLGSGFSPKPSGFTSASVTKLQGSGQYQLSKSNEPYQPPRPYKAAPHSRKDATDMINEETFGSSESSSQDRAEEEKERQASFEQFRKEQKAIHETQKQFPDKHKENVDPDFAALDDKKLWDKNIKLEDTAPKYLQGDLAAHTFASRPLAPPGFTGVTHEKKLGPRSVNSHSTVEVGNGGVHEQNVQIESNATENGTSKSLVDEKSLRRVDPSEKRYEIMTYHTPLTDISEKSVMGGIASPECATSILENLFSKASIVDSGFSNVSKSGDVDADTGSLIPFQSSKFPDRSPREEKRPENGFPSGKPEELCSSIVNVEKDGSQVSRVSDQKTSILPLGSSGLIHKSGTATSCTLAILEPPYQSENSGASLGVLTCEDLEQSILSGFSGSSSPLDQSFESSKGLDAKAEKRPEVDNHASQHLLSLLQKGTSVNDFVQSSIHEPLKNHVCESGSVNRIYNSTVEYFEGVETDPTLEALLGKAFMKELQSVKAPVSGQRGSVGGVTQTHVLDSQGFPFPVRDDGFSNLTSSQTTLPDEKMCLGFDGCQGKVVPNYSTISANDRADEALGVQLPDEESLITFCDAVGNTSNADIVDKIRGLNAAALRKERSSIPVFDDPSVLRGPYKPRDTEFPYQNRHEQPASQFAHLQMTHGRTSFQPSDFHPSYMNIPPKIMGLENNLHPEFSQPNFPANVFHPPFQHVNSAPTRFCPPAQHPMLLRQQMHMQGNMLHPHHLRGLPRGPPAPPYAINPTMQNLDFHHQQDISVYSCYDQQGRAVGGAGHNHPEAFGKRTEMERRAKFRHTNPVAGASRGRGIDMGFRGQAEKEFKVEVEVIGRVRHKNLVRLLGFCVEGDHRMLVYEYVNNGNLDQWLHGDVGQFSPLTWDIRMNVILGTAKGLAYLHEGLEPKVVHRDVKSSNILLDQQWNAKVSDFGLAKLLCSESSYVTTRVMGTYGYVAPEYACTGMLNEKSDIYSFGILMMEIISGRNPVDHSRPPGEVNLVDWLKSMVGDRKAEQVVDPKLQDMPPSKSLKRVLLVALRCVDPDAQKRPKMGLVIHMLEADDSLLKTERRIAEAASHLRHDHSARESARTIQTNETVIAVPRSKQTGDK